MTPEEAQIKFRELVKRKTQRAVEAEIPGYENLEDHSDDLPVEAVMANQWAHKLFGGPFFRAKSKDYYRPDLSTVFVQDKNGNTDTESGNPGDLGGGETDLHLDYEGLSRIDADGVMAGANTVRGSGTVFGIWHPKLLKVRRSLGKNTYPAQIVVTESGKINMAEELMFNLPEIQVYVITTEAGKERILRESECCGQVYFISTGNKIDYHEALAMLKSFGLNKISVVGGRTTVSELFDGGFISDLYLTTSPLETGKPNTPFYVGKKGLPEMEVVLRKLGKGKENGVIFEHYMVK